MNTNNVVFPAGPALSRSARRRRNRKLGRANQQARGTNMRNPRAIATRGFRRRGNRDRRNLRSADSMRSFPRARERTFKRVPDVSNGNVVVVRHIEMLTSWADWVAPYRTLSFPLAPVDLFPDVYTSLTTPWVGQLAALFNLFKLDSIVLRYMGTNTVIEAGSITWAYHTDVADAVPQDTTSMLAYTRSGQQAMMNTEWSVSLPIDSSWRKVPDGTQDKSNLNMFASGVWYVRVDPGINVPSGTFRVEYQYSFANPVPATPDTSGFVTDYDTQVTPTTDIMRVIQLDEELIVDPEFDSNWSVDFKIEGGNDDDPNVVLTCLQGGTYSIDFGRAYDIDPAGDYSANLQFDGTMYVDNNNYTKAAPDMPESFLSKCLNKLVWVVEKGQQLMMQGTKIFRASQVIIGALAPLVGGAVLDEIKTPLWKQRNMKARKILKRLGYTALRGKGLSHPYHLWKSETKIDFLENTEKLEKVKPRRK